MLNYCYFLAMSIIITQCTRYKGLLDAIKIIAQRQGIPTSAYIKNTLSKAIQNDISKLPKKTRQSLVSKGVVSWPTWMQDRIS